MWHFNSVDACMGGMCRPTHSRQAGAFLLKYRLAKPSATLRESGRTTQWIDGNEALTDAGRATRVV